MSLHVLHGVAAGAHFLQAAALSYLAVDAHPTEYPWPIIRLGWQEILQDKKVQVKLSSLLPIFPGLSAANHATCFFASDWYDQRVKEKFNWLKWAEYSISAQMILPIAILSGVNDVRSLVSLAILNVGLQMMGLMIEKRKSEQAPLSELLAWMGIGWAIFLAMWSEILIAFNTIAIEDSAPPVVYSIVWSMFTLFSSFGVVQLLYIYDMVSFETYEKALIGLSMAAKSVLVWLVYGGVIMGEQRIEQE